MLKALTHLEIKGLSCTEVSSRRRRARGRPLATSPPAPLLRPLIHSAPCHKPRRGNGVINRTYKLITVPSPPRDRRYARSNCCRVRPGAGPGPSLPGPSRATRWEGSQEQHGVPEDQGGVSSLSGFFPALAAWGRNYF